MREVEGDRAAAEKEVVSSRPEPSLGAYEPGPRMVARSASRELPVCSQCKRSEQWLMQVGVKTGT